MQGTSHVRSLIRLFIGAVLLCLAWLVLTSGHASAAERPDPTHHRSDLGRTLPRGVDPRGLEMVLEGVLGQRATPAAQADRPAPRAAASATSHASRTAKPPLQKRSGAREPAKHATSAKRPTTAPTKPSSPSELVLTGVVDDLARPVAPVIAQVDAAGRSALDAGLDLVTGVTDAAVQVPLVGAPLGEVTRTVLAVVHTLPAVGVPAPIVPLPIGDGPPAEVGPISVPGFLGPVATGPLPTTLDGVVVAASRAGCGWPSQPGDRRPGESSVVRSQVQAGPAGDPEPTAPGSPPAPAPALPGQPAPTGPTPSTGDPAVATADLVLPESSLFRRGGADWRVPRGLPSHPGTRPD